MTKRQRSQSTTESLRRTKRQAKGPRTFTDVNSANSSSVKHERIVIDDPDTVIISKASPRRQLIEYILTRLQLPPTDAAKSTDPQTDSTDTTSPSPSRSVVLLSCNSAMQTCTSITEIIKRRLPHASYRVDIGSSESQNSAPDSSASSSTAERPPARVYAMRVEFRVDQ
jgi:hypothetical protein